MSFLSICPILLHRLTLQGSRDAAFGSDCLLLMHINMFQCTCCFNFNVGSAFYFPSSLEPQMTWSVLHFCTSECKPFAAVTFSILSLQWLSSTLPAFWCRWQWLFLRSSNHFFQKVVFEVFLFIISRSIIVLNIADLFQGGNLTWCHLVFCEHPIRLHATYSNYLFGGTLFLNTSLDDRHSLKSAEKQADHCRSTWCQLKITLLWWNILSWRAWNCFGIRKQ